MCWYPVRISYKGGYMDVSCRNCPSCSNLRAKNWGARCYYELKEHKEAMFLTLTYRENPYVIEKRDLQLFIMRLRKFLRNSVKIKYFAVGEYGEKGHRPHYHIMIFGYEFKDLYPMGQSARKNLMYGSRTLDRLWGKGRATVQDATMDTAVYTALYLNKDSLELQDYAKCYPPFNLMSQGLGRKGMLEALAKSQSDVLYINGKKQTVPSDMLEWALKHSKCEQFKNKCFWMLHDRRYDAREKSLTTQIIVKVDVFVKLQYFKMNRKFVTTIQNSEYNRVMAKTIRKAIRKEKRDGVC